MEKLTIVMEKITIVKSARFCLMSLLETIFVRKYISNIFRKNLLHYEEIRQIYIYTKTKKNYGKKKKDLFLKVKR